MGPLLCIQKVSAGICTLYCSLPHHGAAKHLCSSYVYHPKWDYTDSSCFYFLWPSAAFRPFDKVDGRITQVAFGTISGYVACFFYHIIRLRTTDEWSGTLKQTYCFMVALLCRWKSFGTCSPRLLSAVHGILTTSFEHTSTLTRLHGCRRGYRSWQQGGYIAQDYLIRCIAVHCRAEYLPLLSPSSISISISLYHKNKLRYRKKERYMKNPYLVGEGAFPMANKLH